MDRKIAIIIPTLSQTRGQATAKVARATAGTKPWPETIVAHDSKGQGFTKTVNAGIRRVLSVPDIDICILNDDIEAFQYGWLEIMRRALYFKHEWGLACPSGKSAATPMNQGLPGMSGYRVVKQASFWCVLLKREMVDELGILDERFIHYCSDNDYCDRMRSAGWKCVWARGAYLTHKHHGSGIRSAWRSRDRAEYFRRKRA